MYSVILKSTGLFLFVCASEKYIIGEDQDIVNSLPPEEMGEHTTDELGTPTVVFNVKWENNQWIKT